MIESMIILLIACFASYKIGKIVGYRTKITDIMQKFLQLPNIKIKQPCTKGLDCEQC